MKFDLGDLNIDWRKLLSTAGMFVAVVGAYAAVSLAMEVWAGGDGETTPAVYAGLIVSFGGTALAGVYLARRMDRPPAPRPVRPRRPPPAPEPPPTADPEQAVLALARR
jgi:hypothetical protein